MCLEKDIRLDDKDKIPIEELSQYGSPGGTVLY